MTEVPLVKVSMAIAEKVGLKNYSNIDVGPAVVERLVEDTPEAIAQGLAACAAHAEKIVFAEADEIRRTHPDSHHRAHAVQSEAGVESVNGNGDDPMLEAKRILLAEKILQLPPKLKNAVKLRLVALGVTNPTTPQAALAVLDAEKVPVLESWLNSLQEDSTNV